MAGGAAVIVAAGRGLRAGADMPKQFRQIGGAPMIRRSLLMFVEHAKVGAVQTVIHQDDVAMFQSSVAGLDVLPPVFGGATRQASVRAGLEALNARPPDIVLIHDAARPFASAELIARAIAAALRTGAAIPALPVTDTVKSVDAAGLVDKTLERNTLRLVQTPQAFAFAPLLAAHRRAAAEGRDDFTDDAALADAILGSLAEGDIGAHFPPSDPQWRNASSDRFLAFAVERVSARGGRIAHLDLTLVCEAPRIGTQRDAMRAKIAALAGVAIARVAVKATTSEKLGFTGRGEGIAAYATATVRLPWGEP